jgi:hypothetical protein
LPARVPECQVSPIVSPERVRAMKERGELTPQRAAEYRGALERIRRIEARRRGGANAELLDEGAAAN